MRIATVPYLNCLPLVVHLESPPLQIPPSRLAEALLNDQVDVALMPTVSILKNNFYAYPQCGLIGCDGEVKSVGFFLKNSVGDLSQIKTIYLDQESATSVRLGEIILREVFHRELNAITMTPLTKRNEADAQLLIGDKALFFETPNYFYIDLGTLWQKLTNTGFMFACWAAKRPLTLAEQATLTQAKTRGLETRSQWVEQCVVKDRMALLNYLTHNIIYTDTPRILAGFEKFKQRLA